MFDEMSTQAGDYQAPRPAEPAYNDEKHKRQSGIILEIVESVLSIESSSTNPHPDVVARFDGHLKMDSESAFDVLDSRLEELDCHAMLRVDDETEKDVVIIVSGRYAPQERPWWPNALLLLLTIPSLMWAGAIIDGEMNILKGLPYALSVLLILGSHELGHYFAARYHKVAVTLPYMIPFPPVLGFGFGTLGAFIQLREPMRNRKQLFDIGIAGPLAGLIFAVPILLIGISTAKVHQLPEDDPYILEGNSILYATSKYVIHGKWLPTKTEDMTLNQLSFAGWTGLFVTSLNLLPLGQLDGGHILYSLLGRHARKSYYPVVLGMFGLAIFVNQGFLLWSILLLLLGRLHAVPLNDIAQLDRKRQILGTITLIILIFIFIPSPLTMVNM